jgi:hypothetical protein
VLPACNDWNVAFNQLQLATNLKFQDRRQTLLDDPRFKDSPADLGRGPRATIENQLEMKPRSFVFEVSRDDQSLATREAPAEPRMRTYSTWAAP